MNECMTISLQNQQIVTLQGFRVELLVCFDWLKPQREWLTSRFTGVLILLFSILAVNGGMAVLNLIVLAVIFAACGFLTFIVGRQPQSKTKLSFKVWGEWGCLNTENFITLLMVKFRCRFLGVAQSISQGALQYYIVRPINLFASLLSQSISNTLHIVFTVKRKIAESHQQLRLKGLVTLSF